MSFENPPRVYSISSVENFGAGGFGNQSSGYDGIIMKLSVMWQSKVSFGCYNSFQQAQKQNLS